MNYVFLVLGILLLGAGLFFVIKTLRGFHKAENRNELTKKEVTHLVGGLFGVALSGLFLQVAINRLAGFALTTGQQVMSFFGALLFFLFFCLLWVAFYLRFWCPHTCERQLRKIKIALYGSIPLALFSFLLLGEGVGGALSYPLVCGFCINNSGWHWLTAANVGTSECSGGFSIRWYGIVIVFGALVCYWVSDHKFYQKYGQHGILDTLLLFCFPGGILGARIWYVVGNWEVGGFSKDFSQVFRIWDGGLTILGGAVGGIIVGVTYMLLRRKWVDIRFAMDVIVPTILLGQAIGRWGNFFNNEVYGQTVALSSGWQWLPTWIANQMHFDGASKTFLADGMINVPLFLVESALNIFGYFLIAYIVPSIWKKKRGLGVLSGLYLVWYGIVRIIMEPMRNASYNMGKDGMWSIWNSMVYIILGVLLTAFFEFMWIKQRGKSWSRGSLEKAQEAASVKAEKAPGRKAKPTVEQKDITSAPTFHIGEEKNTDQEKKE